MTIRPDKALPALPPAPQKAVILSDFPFSRPQYREIGASSCSPCQACLTFPRSPRWTRAPLPSPSPIPPEVWCPTPR